MAFPYLSEANFEDGTAGHFDTESDSGSRLTFDSYKTLARAGLAAPWRGAYAMRVDLSLNTTDAYVQETGAWDTAADGTIHHRFMVWVDPNIVMAAGDEFAIFELWSSTNTVEVSVMIHNNAGKLEWAVDEAQDPSSASTADLVLNKWTAIEVTSHIDAGGGNDGTIDMYIDGTAVTQITGADQGAITSGVVGVLGQDAGTTAGNILFDSIIADDARVYPPTDRYTEQLVLTSSGHAFVGHGVLDNITLNSGAGTDCELRVWDTDSADTTDLTNYKVELKNTANNEVVDPAGMPLRLIRGCYVELAGTNPKATVSVCHAPGAISEAYVKNLGVSG